MQWPKVTTSNSWGCGGTVSSAEGGLGGQATVSSDDPTV